MVSSTSCLRLKASTHSERGRPSSDPKDSRVRLSGRSGRLISRLNVLSRPGTIPRSAPPQAGRGTGHTKEFRKCRVKANWDDPAGLPLSCLTPFAPAGRRSLEHFPPDWTSLHWKCDSQRAASARKPLRTCVGVQF